MPAIHVAALLKSTPGTSRSYQFEEDRPELGPELTATGVLRGHVRLMRTQDGVLVRCEATVPVQLECARCVEFFDCLASTSFEEEYLPVVNIKTGLPTDIAEDEALQIDEHHILDLAEAIRQYVLTTLPLKPICEPTCRGVCPECGANLNLEPCRCVPGSDGAMAQLADLMRADQGSLRDSPR